MSIFQTGQKVLLEPISFFHERMKETGVKKSFQFYAVGSLIFTAIFAVFIGFFLLLFGVIGSFASGGLSLPIAFLIWLAICIFFYIIELAFGIIFAAVFHVWLMLLGSREGFDKTYQMYSYSMTPVFIGGFIPIVSLFAAVYRLVLMVLGIEAFHKFSRKKAIFAVGIPVAIMALLAMVFYFLYFMLLFATSMSDTY